MWQFLLHMTMFFQQNYILACHSFAYAFLTKPQLPINHQSLLIHESSPCLRLVDIYFSCPIFIYQQYLLHLHLRYDMSLV